MIDLQIPPKTRSQNVMQSSNDAVSSNVSTSSIVSSGQSSIVISRQSYEVGKVVCRFVVDCPVTGVVSSFEKKQ